MCQGSRAGRQAVVQIAETAQQASTRTDKLITVAGNRGHCTHEGINELLALGGYVGVRAIPSYAVVVFLTSPVSEISKGGVSRKARG